MVFIPQFKLVVCTNNLLEVGSQDDGTWRRIRVVEFESLFTENPVDDDLEKPYQYKIVNQDVMDEKCASWKEVFAALLVEIAYKTMGYVKNCERILESSKLYQNDQDNINEFIRDRTEKFNTSCILKTDIIAEISAWFQSNYSRKPPLTKELIPYMDKMYGKIKNGAWIGCRLKNKPIVNNHVGSEISGSIYSDEEFESLVEMAELDDM